MRRTPVGAMPYWIVVFGAVDPEAACLSASVPTAVLIGVSLGLLGPRDVGMLPL